MSKIFTKNCSIKLLAILIASLLWVYASATTTKADAFPGSIPIAPLNLKEDLAAVYDKDEVIIKVMAAKETWRQLSIESFNAYVDLSEMSIGTHEVEVRVTCSVPNVQIAEVNPNKILVRLEPVASAKVPVVVKTDGKPGKGFVVGSGQTDPSEVEIRGAKSLVQTIARATALVKLNGESMDLEKVMKLTAYDDKGKEYKNITFVPEKVKLTLPITKESSGKTVGIKVKLKGSPAPGFWVSRVQTKPQTIDVVAPGTILDKTNFIETPEIDLAGSDKKMVQDVALKLPDKVGFATDQENKIEVTIEISPTGSSREIVAGFSYTGLGSELSVIGVNPGEIKVLVAGEVPILQKLTSANVVINIDLSNKGVGSYFIPISRAMVSVPEGAALVSYLPSSVTINVGGK